MRVPELVGPAIAFIGVSALGLIRINPGTRERPLAAAGPETAACCLRRDGGATSHARGPHAPYQQVHDHPDLPDGWRDDQERVDLLGEIGGRERRAEVHQVTDS